MKTFRVTFEVTVSNEEHPRKWVPEAVCGSMNPGEDCDNWVFVEIDPDTKEPLTK